MTDDWTPWPDGGGPENGPGVPNGPLPAPGRPPDWPDPSIYTPLPRLDGAEFSGAIIDNLDDVARFLRSTATSLVSDIDGLARSIEFSHWIGPRADNVRGLVERQVLPALREMNEQFGRAARVLERNADQQRDASSLSTLPSGGYRRLPTPIRVEP